MRPILFIPLILTLACNQTPVMVDYIYILPKVKSLPTAVTYPIKASEMGKDGIVTVEISLDIQGVPLSAKAIAGPPALYEAAETYLMASRFHPAVLNCSPVPLKKFNVHLKFDNSLHTISIVRST